MTPTLLFALAALSVLVPALLVRELGIAALAAALGLLSTLLALRPRPPWTLFLVLQVSLDVGGAITFGGPWPAVGVAIALAAWDVGLSQADLEGFPAEQRGRATRRRALRSAAVSLGGAGIAVVALATSLQIPFGYVLVLAAALPLALALFFRLVPLNRPPRPGRRWR